MKRTKAAVAFLAGMAMLASLGNVAGADNILGTDGATSPIKVGNALQYEDAASPGAFACSARGTAVTGSATLVRSNGGDVFTAGDVLDLTGRAYLTSDATQATVAGITITPATVTVPSPWTDATGGDAEEHPFTFSTNVASTVPNGAYTAVLVLAKGSLSVDGTFDVNVTCTSAPPTNTRPVVAAPTVTTTSACGVSISTTFTDPDAGQTHTSSINWGDTSSSAGTVDETAKTVTGSHSYATAGTYNITVSVTDDSGAANATGTSGETSYTTKNTASALASPIKADGTSNFKVNSSIPLKLTVTACGGALVTDLTPTVSLAKTDSVPDGTDTTAGTADTATNGKLMWWNGETYIYVLSTKNSQFINTGASLTTGTYRVTVSDASFVAPVTAQFDLKK